MLSKNELVKFAKTLGFNLGQVEKDYLQHLFLLFLSRHTKNELIFKGGTALQKIYAMNRFSEDIDFTLNESINIENLLAKIKKDFANIGVDSEIKKIKETSLSLNYLLKFKGPLYDETERTKTSLRIEISLREKVLLKPDVKEIVPIYPDIQPYIVLVMNLQEVLAEKIRAIMTRNKARDVYDLWFLLRKNVKIVINLVNEKLSFYKMKFSKKQFFESLKEKEKLWEKELLPLVTFLPEFAFVSKEIRKRL